MVCLPVACQSAIVRMPLNIYAGESAVDKQLCLQKRFFALSRAVDQLLCLSRFLIACCGICGAILRDCTHAPE